MIYPYAGRDLFAEPESYAYAKCDDARFLEEWKKSRMAAKLALVRRANQPLEGERKTHTNAAADAITLSSLLEGQISSNGDRIPGENHATVLESFVAKFEVFGRLFAWYRNDGRQPPRLANRRSRDLHPICGTLERDRRGVGIAKTSFGAAEALRRSDEPAGYSISVRRSGQPRGATRSRSVAREWCGAK